MVTLMLPELIVVGTAFGLLFLDLFLSESRKHVIAPLALVGLAAAFVVTVGVVPMDGELFGGRFSVDAVTWWFKLLFLLAGLLTVAISADMLDGRARVPVEGLGFRGEYYTVLLFTVAGMMYLISARDLVTLYVSLELTTIPLFVLAAWRRDRLAGEAGLKYIILGALASSLLLYGLGLLYGLSGSTDLETIANALNLSGTSPGFWLACALVIAGVGFKLTMVPFHMWAADVYQGAPTPITAYLSVASKGAGLAFMFQLFYRMLGQFILEAGVVIAILAALTMTWGNVVAIVQQNIKRFMAFSAISQAGYLIMGFLGAAPEGVPAMIFYMMVYIVSNLAVFGVIIFYSNATGKEMIKDYQGLSRTNPLLALAMMLALFSLAGIPPLAGFVGKFFLFSIASKAGFHWLVAVAAVNSTVSLYYYLRIVRQMYIEPETEGAERLPVSPILSVTVGATALGAVLLGIIPFFYETIHAHTSGWLPL
jgi:NADH-quinone oxidoreductase subunit N